MKSVLQQEASDRFPLLGVSLNHVSFLCSSLQDSERFYQDVLGFRPIRRPSSFNFEGAWLYNYGIGVHLLQRGSSAETLPQPLEIDPKRNHISFQCADIGRVRKRLDDMGIGYVTAVVKEGGIKVDQLFFHDPDCNMIEICNCDKLPIVPLSSSLLPLRQSQGSPRRSHQSFKRYHSFAGYIGEDNLREFNQIS